jgi:hypothetical protein
LSGRFAISASLSHKSSEDAAAKCAALSRTSSPDTHLLVLILQSAVASRPAARVDCLESNLAATGGPRGGRSPDEQGGSPDNLPLAFGVTE